MEEVGQFHDQEQDQEVEEEEEEEEEDSSLADRTFRDPDLTPSPASLKKFPTPPSVPQQVGPIHTDMDNVGLAMMRQIKQEKDVAELDMAGLENRLEAVMMKRM